MIKVTLKTRLDVIYGRYSMITLQGKSVYRDICVGRLVFYGGRKEAARRVVENPEGEFLQFEGAVEAAKEQLRALYEESVRTVGAANAAVFQAQELLLEDEEYRESVRQMVYGQRVNVEYAVQMTGENMARAIQAVEDAYIRERSGDILDITERLLGVLNGSDKGRELPTEPFILVAEDLLPSEVAQLSRSRVVGLALRRGSVHSHAAVLGRNMGIPFLMKLGEELSDEYDGAPAVIDGFSGVLYIAPDGITLARLEEKKREWSRQKELLWELKGKENITRDGKTVKVFANVGSLTDVEAACANDAGGIGLLRSEVLYLESAAPPNEEMQFAFYKQVLERMNGREVVVRTFDFGADKQVPWLGQEPEKNPALGLRGIRLGLEQPQLLKTQLCALYRAGIYGKLRIMYPMITSMEELRQLRHLERQVRHELEREGVRFAESIPTGIMIETPAAALLSDQLAGEVDFFSVGTNDLTQYTLALDRQNENLERFDDPGHEAVLRLIKMTAKNAHEAGIQIGICGELAGDIALTEEFLRMGIDELSVSPEEILELRQRIREI